MSQKSSRTKLRHKTKMTILGISLGVFLAIIIGVILYVLNVQHKWDLTE